MVLQVVASVILPESRVGLGSIGSVAPVLGFVRIIQPQESTE